MMVVHLKARSEGRNTTQWRRVGAARDIKTALETRFDGKLTYHNGNVYSMRGVKQVRPV